MILLQYTIFTNNTDPSCRYEFRIQEYITQGWAIYNVADHNIIRN